MDPRKRTIITLAATIALASLTGFNPSVVSQFVNSSLSLIAEQASIVSPSPQNVEERQSTDGSGDKLPVALVPNRECKGDSFTLTAPVTSSNERIGGIRLRVPDLLSRDPRCAVNSTGSAVDVGQIALRATSDRDGLRS